MIKFEYSEYLRILILSAYPNIASPTSHLNFQLCYMLNWRAVCSLMDGVQSSMWKKLTCLCKQTYMEDIKLTSYWKYKLKCLCKYMHIVIT